MINTPGTPQEKPIRTVKDKDKSYLLEICKFNNLSKVNLWRKLSEEEKMFIHSKFPDCVIEESTED